MRYLIDVAYDGSNYHGFQKQTEKSTIQGKIEDVLTMINGGCKVKTIGAGRTDAKVNARHQILHFDLKKDIKPYKLKGALNSYLPNDIYVNDVKHVDDLFHARYMVKTKLYEYKINIGSYNPLIRNYVYQYCKPLDISKINEGIKYLVGTHDFTTFASSEDKRSDKVRTIKEINIEIKDEIITISFLGTGFLKYQIRNMVGLLIKIGERKFDSCLIPDVIDKKDRKAIGLTAPAEGLTLVRVNY